MDKRDFDRIIVQKEKDKKKLDEATIALSVSFTRPFFLGRRWVSSRKE